MIVGSQDEYNELMASKEESVADKKELEIETNE
jgi:hypothetical protein